MIRIYTRKFVVLGLTAMLIALLALPSCTPATGNSDNPASGTQTTTQIITDDAGREVVLPVANQLERVFYTGPNGQIFLFTLAPELCAGTTLEFTEQELENLPVEATNLPYLGSTSSGAELNPEAIMAEGIQVIFQMTSAAPGDGDVSAADDLQNQTGIPVVVLDASFDQTARCYERLGEILDRQEAAARLADYCRTTLEEVRNAVATIPEDERVTLYYAEGPEGLQTEPVNSTHSLIFELAGARNVAGSLDEQGATGRTIVSLEQILAWNPEVIVAWDNLRHGGGADELIRTDPNWSSLQAVQNGRVYTMCNTPFSWIDRPASVNRFIGLQWLTNLLYPKAYDIDILETTKEFYSLFYHRELTDEQAIELLGNSYQG